MCSVAMVYDESTFYNKTSLTNFFCNKTLIAENIKLSCKKCNKTTVAKKFCNKTYVAEIILQQDMCCSTGDALNSLDAANPTAREPADLLKIPASGRVALP